MNVPIALTLVRIVLVPLVIVAVVAVGWWMSRTPQESPASATPAVTAAKPEAAAGQAKPGQPAPAVADSTAASRKPVMAAGATPNPNVVGQLAVTPLNDQQRRYAQVATPFKVN